MLGHSIRDELLGYLTQVMLKHRALGGFGPMMGPFHGRWDGDDRLRPGTECRIVRAMPPEPPGDLP
jgi:hypothetical protein